MRKQKKEAMCLYEGERRADSTCPSIMGEKCVVNNVKPGIPNRKAMDLMLYVMMHSFK